MRYHFSSIRLAKIKKMVTPFVGKYWEKRHFYSLLVRVQIDAQHSWKTTVQHLSKLKSTYPSVSIIQPAQYNNLSLCSLWINASHTSVFFYILFSINVFKYIYESPSNIKFKVWYRLLRLKFSHHILSPLLYKFSSNMSFFFLKWSSNPISKKRQYIPIATQYWAPNVIFIRPVPSTGTAYQKTALQVC